MLFTYQHILNLLCLHSIPVILFSEAAGINEHFDPVGYVFRTFVLNRGIFLCFVFP